MVRKRLQQIPLRLGPLGCLCALCRNLESLLRGNVRLGVQRRPCTRSPSCEACCEEALKVVRSKVPVCGLAKPLPRIKAQRPQQIGRLAIVSKPTIDLNQACPADRKSSKRDTAKNSHLMLSPCEGDTNKQPREIMPETTADAQFSSPIDQPAKKPFTMAKKVSSRLSVEGLMRDSCDGRSPCTLNDCAS